VLAMDILGVTPGDAADPEEFARFVAGLNLLIRANDEVIDEIAPYSDAPVTADQLNETPVFHKLAQPGGRLVTGAEGMRIAMEATDRLIPGSSPGAISRRNEVQGLLAACTIVAADTANNPAYHGGMILPFPTAERIKYETNGFLGEVCIAVVAALLKVPETAKDRELYRQIGVALQFGDDLFDWRRDWLKYRAKSAESDRPVRPQQNLFNATLLENDSELAACEAVLTDTGRRSAVLAGEVAVLSYAEFQSRFRDVLARYPAGHRYTEKARRITDFLISTVVPRAPETGRFFEWAKL